ncbi:PGF-CTERM sorting domain-containing protein [Haloarcula amylolytica]|uniref:PGF-CTERM sorting domain-containing protein n=1 Tax=Haloarcula amylolytica TaxID=396317 RepID=UPI003C71DD21
MTRMPTAVTLLITLAVALSVAVTPVAAASLTITGVAIPDSVAQGDSFDIEVSVSGQDVQNVAASLTLPDGISCSPAGTQSVSISGGSGSAVFDCSADATGDYSGEITASVTADETSSSSTRSDATQTGLQVLSPASLTVSHSISSDTVDAGQTTELDVVIHNTGDVSTSYNASLGDADGYASTLTSGTDDSDIAGGETRTLTYEVTGNSGGSYTLTSTATGGNGQTVTEVTTLSVSGDDSGGGGGDDSSSPAVTSTPESEATETGTETQTSVMTDTAPESQTDVRTATPGGDEPTPADGVASDQDAASADGSDSADTGATSARNGPGFGVVSAVLALSLAVFLARRRP